jgi:Domain of unknown function (DUF4303)
VVNMEWLRVMEAWLPEVQDLIPPALESVTAGRDDVVAVALFTDSDARTLQPAALSRGRLAELQAESPDYAVLYAWDPDEWDLLPGQGDRNDLSSVMAKVAALAEDVDEAQWESFLLLAFNWMVEGMKNLAKEGFFDAAYPGANVAFWVTDTRVHRENMIEWIQLLNPPERSAPYVAYLREHGL